MEGFEEYTATAYDASSGVVPDCWDEYSLPRFIAPHISASSTDCYVHDGNNALFFYGGGDNYAALPEFTNDLRNLKITFWINTYNISSDVFFALGYITSEDNGTFNTFTAIPGITVENSQNYHTIEERSYLLNNIPSDAKRLAFLWHNHHWPSHCSIDDVKVELATHTITATASSAESGTVEGAGTYNYGSTAMLTATANTCYHFVNWTLGETEVSTDATYSFTVTEDTVYVANFELNQPTTGIDEKEACGSYTWIDGMTYTASTNEPTFTLTNTAGCDSIVTLHLTVNNPVHTAITETACGSYTWTDGNGQTYTESGDYTYSYEDANGCTQVDTLHLTVNPTYNVTDAATILSTELPYEWNGVTFTEAGTQIATLQSANGCDSVVTMTLTVNTVEYHTITVTVSDDTPWGTVTGSGVFAAGTTDTLTATALENYVFLGWSDNNTDNPRIITVTQDSTFTAYFILEDHDEIEIPVNDSVMGFVSITIPSNATPNTMVTITAVPEPHYHFVSWSDENTENPRMVTLMQALHLTAIFAIDQHTISVLSSDENMGTVSVGGTFDYGTEISISADAREGYRFVAWNDGNTENPRTITVEQDSTFVAYFEVADGIHENDGNSISIYSYDNQIVVINAEGLSIEIFDMSGRLVVSENRITTSERNYTLYAPGIYLVKVGDNIVKKVKIITR